MRELLGRFGRPERTAGNQILTTGGRFALAIIVGLLALLGPVAAIVEPFWLFLLVQILVFALLALSLDFVFGYAGLLSFGHAAMFGAGGYAAALLIAEVTANALVVEPRSIPRNMLLVILLPYTRFTRLKVARRHGTEPVAGALYDWFYPRLSGIVRSLKSDRCWRFL
jgi:ABC-type branched-subunit amino acid transport system permease subunit